MWELIRANKRNSIILMAMMAAALLGLGLVIGMSFFGYEGALFGVAIAVGVWTILSLLSYSSGDKILLAASKAKRVDHDVHPQLFNVVEEMKIASGLPMPKVYIINDPAPNAFATGRKPETASVAVTAGLLSRLNRDELQGVIAHEMSHILHRDILFVTMAGIMLGSIVLLSEVFLRGMFYSSLMGGRRRRFSSGSGGGGQAQIIMIVIAIAAAILAPIMAYLLYFALSRRREYLADAGAARLTRYPEGLASALEKISTNTQKMESANKVTAPMYIVNPLKAVGGKLSNLSSTHPPISERISILRNMAGGASYQDYAGAYSNITKSKSSVVPATALKDEAVPKRGAQAEQEPADDKQKEKLHQLDDIMRRVNGFLFLTCMCGLKLKVPPNYKKDHVQCPKCKRQLDLAQAKQKPASA